MENLNKKNREEVKHYKFIFFLIMLGFTSIGIQAQSLTDYIQITDNSNHFMKSYWSPHGDKLMLITEKYSNIFTYEIETQKLSEIASGDGVGFNAFWSNNDKIQYTTGANKLCYSTTESKTTSSTFDNYEDTIVYINKKTLLVEAKYKNQTWAVTNIIRQYYYPVLSPDSKSVIVHSGANIYLLDMDNPDDEILIGQGIATSWSSDNNLILFFKDLSDDGVSISSSEVYMYNVSENKTIQLTYTNEFTELWPVMSPDSKHIVFTDEKTGQIFLGTLNY